MYFGDAQTKEVQYVLQNRKCAMINTTSYLHIKTTRMHVVVPPARPRASFSLLIGHVLLAFYYGGEEVMRMSIVSLEGPRSSY